MSNDVKFSIYRFNPDVDKKPYMQDYSIELADEDNMLLDGLMRLKERDDTLTMRKSCREGVCGSDSMNINGKWLGLHYQNCRFRAANCVTPDAWLASDSRFSGGYDAVF